MSYGYAAQEPYSYDLKRAKALLAEAGWKETPKARRWTGERMSLVVLFPQKHYGQSFDEMTPAVVEMLKDLGLEVTVRPVDFGTLLQTVQKGTLPWNGGFTACRTSNNLDADDYVRDWTALTLINWVPYPPDLLEAYRATRREVDPQKRLRLLADLQRQVPRLGAGGADLPGGEGLRPRRAGASLRALARAAHGLPGRRPPENERASCATFSCAAWRTRSSSCGEW